jgi:hypothetical protein
MLISLSLNLRRLMLREGRAKVVEVGEGLEL